MCGTSPPRFVALAVPRFGGLRVVAAAVVTLDGVPFVVVEGHDMRVWFALAAAAAPQLKVVDEYHGFSVGGIVPCVSNLAVVGGCRGHSLANCVVRLNVRVPLGRWAKLERRCVHVECGLAEEVLHVVVELGSSGEERVANLCGLVGCGVGREIDFGYVIAEPNCAKSFLGGGGGLE